MLYPLSYEGGGPGRAYRRGSGRPGFAPGRSGGQPLAPASYIRPARCRRACASFTCGLTFNGKRAADVVSLAVEEDTRARRAIFRASVRLNERRHTRPATRRDRDRGGRSRQRRDLCPVAVGAVLPAVPRGQVRARRPHLPDPADPGGDLRPARVQAGRAPRARTSPIRTRSTSSGSPPGRARRTSSGSTRSVATCSAASSTALGCRCSSRSSRRSSPRSSASSAGCSPASTAAGSTP